MPNSEARYRERATAYE